MSNRNSPVISDIKYHFVWPTKFFTSILIGEVKVAAREIALESCKDINITVLDGRVGKNFVHIKVSNVPRLASSKIMRRVKGRASKVLQERFPHIKEMNLHGSLWEESYFCATIGDESEVAVS